MPPVYGNGYRNFWGGGTVSSPLRGGEDPVVSEGCVRIRLH